MPAAGSPAFDASLGEPVETSGAIARVIAFAGQKGGTGKSRLVGSVNGGGPRLKLRSSGGDVTVRTR